MHPPDRIPPVAPTAPADEGPPTSTGATTSETGPPTSTGPSPEWSRHPTIRLGQWGEQLAAAHLSRAGMEILDRNWRCATGEIDIVARDGDTVVVCEVKTRSGRGFGSPLEGVDQTKLLRLHRLAVRWLADHHYRRTAVRVDVVGVLATPGRPPLIEHLQGVS